MSVQMDSLSASLILGNTIYRNKADLGKKMVGQVGYALTAVVAAVETVALIPFLAISMAFYKLNDEPFEYYATWIESSGFCVAWSLFDFLVNPFCDKLIADEKSAREVLDQGDLFMLPPNAII